MLDKLRPATPEEVKGLLAENADLPQGSSVYAFERPDGPADLVIIRPVLEVDLAYAQVPLRRRTILMWQLENVMRALGVQEYRFNVDPADTAFHATIKQWGGQVEFDPPELRFKKAL